MDSFSVKIAAGWDIVLSLIKDYLGRLLEFNNQLLGRVNDSFDSTLTALTGVLTTLISYHSDDI